MHICDFAIQMERDGRDYYSRLADQSTAAGLKTIFTQLAEDEQKHIEIFRELKAQKQVPAFAESASLSRSKNIFRELLKTPQVPTQVNESLAAYQYAMKLEAASFRLYEESSGTEQDPAIKKLLLQIAAEELNHFQILENIYHFVDAPNQYLAWGEFSNLDEVRQFGRDIDA